eukprot:SAG11_NODE_2077_length_3856_cov_2.082246_3_plen_329_part_00
MASIPKPPRHATTAGCTACPHTLNDGGAHAVCCVDRLNIFGFLGGDEVAARSSGSGAGNFGIQVRHFSLPLSPPPSFFGSLFFSFSSLSLSPLPLSPPPPPAPAHPPSSTASAVRRRMLRLYFHDAGPAICDGMGKCAHRSFWRRSRFGDDLWRECWRQLRHQPPRTAGIFRALRPRHRRERRMCVAKHALVEPRPRFLSRSTLSVSTLSVSTLSVSTLLLRSIDDAGAAPMAKAEKGYQNVLAKTECSDIVCLLALPAKVLEAASSALPFVGCAVAPRCCSGRPCAQRRAAPPQWQADRGQREPKRDTARPHRVEALQREGAGRRRL